MRRSNLFLLMVLAGCAGKTAPESASAGSTSSDGSETVQLSVDERISKAAALLTTGQAQHAQEAITELQPLLIEEPTRVEIPYNMALAYHQLNDGLSARKFYMRATAIEPSLGSAWLNLGALSEKEGQYRKALQHYRAGLQNAPEMGELVVGVIATLRRMGRHDEAIREAKTALARDANNIDVFNNLGLVYIDKGQPDLALFIYQKALNTIDGADDNATLHANLGRAYLAKDRSANAKKELDKALALDPNLVPAMMYLSQLAMDDHDWDKTARLLERAVELDEKNAAIHTNLGIAYRGLGQYELARKEYETALKLDPENPDPYINIGLLLGEHVKDYVGGIAAIQTYRSRGGAHRDRADALLTEFQKRKKKYDDDLARKSKREADAKKREEEARLAAEYEAMQEQWRKEQEEKKKQEEAKKAAAAAAAAAAMGGAAGAAGAQGTAADPATSAPPANSPGAWDAPPAAGPAPIPPPANNTWGSPTPAPEPGPAAAPEPAPAAAPEPAPAAAPEPAPAAAPEPAPVTNAWGAPAPVVTPPPEPAQGTRVQGAPCATDNQCMEGLVCGGGVCTGDAAPAAAPAQRGSRVEGAPCSSDNQCAETLSCVANKCAGSGGAQGNDWGGW